MQTIVGAAVRGSHLRRFAHASLRSAFRVAERVKDAVETSPRVRRFFYEFRNRHAFSDLWQHDRMLADRLRVDTYSRAIARHVKEGDVVVDLGTGTGILALLAAKNRPRKVYAIDHSNLIAGARRVAEANGITGIEFHKVHSRNFNPPEKVDVILHEQLGEAVFDEDMVENVADLRARVLKPGGRVLPGVIEMFVEPVEMLENHRIPFLWEQTIEGIRFDALRELAGDARRGYRRRFVNPLQWDHLLCHPQPVVRVDLATAKPSDLPNRIARSRIVQHAGQLDGFVVFFRASFDDEICLDDSTTNTSWSIPMLRVESQRYEAGDRIAFELRSNNLANVDTWEWSCRGVGKNSERASLAGYA
ncbi:MAG: class I SAM-dependent methyltransferase [Planctomycetes bacterium]|nr:class I SAM-dependent methyltransferase [Planctomycetota bacterium]MBI3847316.1 class I SAM-dependent methyltransferase [Planctomycetota bacterium]